MLDIETEKGQETLQWERDAVSILKTAYPEISYLETPKDQPICYDAMLLVSGRTIGICETKCRQMTLQQLIDWQWMWLVTRAKLIECYTVSCRMRVPLWGLLYLVPDKIALFARLYCPLERKWLVEITSEETETQATVNGGTAVRVNAFIDMSGATRIT